MPLAPDTPKPESLARLAVNALSWQLFWVHTPLAGQVDRYKFLDFYEVHEAWGEDANLISGE